MSQPYRRLTCSTPELRAQLNLTNDHKRKESPHLKNVLTPVLIMWHDEHVEERSTLLKETVVAASGYADNEQSKKR